MNPEVWEFSKEMLFSAPLHISLSLVIGSFGVRLITVTAVAHETCGLASSICQLGG